MKTTWKTGSPPVDATPVVTTRDTSPPPPDETDTELWARHKTDLIAAVAAQPIAPNTELKTAWSIGDTTRHAVEQDVGSIIPASLISDHMDEVLDSLTTYPIYPPAN